GRRLLAAHHLGFKTWSIPQLDDERAVSTRHALDSVQFLSDEEAFAIRWNLGEPSAFYGLLIDVPSGAIAKEVKLAIEYPRPAAINSARSVLAAASGERLVLVSFADGAVLHELPGHAGPISDSRFSALAFSSDDRTLITSGRDGTLCEWEVDTGR